MGYTVLDPNYRGSTGYGIEFKEKIKEDGWGGLEQDDISVCCPRKQDGLVKTGKRADRVGPPVYRMLYF